MWIRIALVCVTILMTLHVGSAQAELVEKTITYKHDEVELDGFLVYDSSIEGPRPGVLVIHEWWGLNDYVKQRARQLAKLGYVAFAANMYGKGVVTTDRREAAQLSNVVKQTPLIRTRSQVGLDTLLQHELVDKQRVAAMGYCFGGTAALELAFSGAPLVGAVSFHGGLVIPRDDDTSIQAKVLVLHGAIDPFVPPPAVNAFQQSMEEFMIDYQLVAYGGAVHTFTNPAAGDDIYAGSAYNQAADQRSWGHMKLFFDEIFAQPAADENNPGNTDQP